MINLAGVKKPKDTLLNTRELEETLHELSGEVENDINAMCWTITTQKHELRVDFSHIDEFRTKFPSWFNKFSISPTLLAKYIWLQQADTGCNTYQYLNGFFSNITLLFSYMAENDLHSIDTEQLYPLFEWILIHEFGKPIYKRPNIKAYGSFYRYFNLIKINLLLKEIGIENFLCGVRERHIKEALKDAVDILSGGEMTFNQWKDGGSLNFLTLDYGCYYVEFCQGYFDKHINNAQVLAKIINESEQSITKLGAKGKSYRAIQKILSGENIESLIETLSLKEDIAYQIDELVKTKYEQYMLPLLRHDYLLSSAGINELVDILAIPRQQHILDKLSFIAEQLSLNKNIGLIKKVLTGDFKNLKLNTLSSAVESIKCAAPVVAKLPDEKFYNKLGFLQAYNGANSIVKNYITSVRDAGLTYFVSLNGWRKSEYAFPTTSVSATENLDPLDKNAYPMRFKVDWHVFKTHGDTLTEREITHTSYRLINQLSLLHKGHDKCPAMYYAKQSVSNIKDSGKRIENSVKANWARFVQHYEPFKALKIQNEIKELLSSQDSGGIVEYRDSRRIQELRREIESNGWQKYIDNLDLENAFERAQDERVRVEFYLTGSENSYKKNWLVKYKSHLLSETHELPEEWIAMLDSSISEETKDYIRSAHDSYLRNISVSRTISAEVIDGCLYPTPHAFRHMWAEAVYRRFDGDVGWMIRSQFKHITMGMWLAYIRDKDNRNLNKQVQVAVKTSLLNNWLQNEGKEHSGRFHVFLRRLFNITKLRKVEELNNVIENLAKLEISDIKANPWGFCLLRRTNIDLAQCAEEGVPQRQNASPSLCLGCHHNLTKSSNVDYIVFETMQHIALLSMNNLEQFPRNILWNSYDLIKKAAKHIKTLAPDHEVLDEYKTAMMAYEKLASRGKKNA